MCLLLKKKQKQKNKKMGRWKQKWCPPIAAVTFSRPLHFFFWRGLTLSPWSHTTRCCSFDDDRLMRKHFFIFSKLFVNGGDSNCDYERAKKKKKYPRKIAKKKQKNKPKHVYRVRVICFVLFFISSLMYTTWRLQYILFSPLILFYIVDSS